MKAQRSTRTRRGFLRDLRGLPVSSLRARIFLAMVAGALMVYIAAGIAVMNRISDDFDQRVAMQSNSAGRLAWQFYRQQEDHLVHTAQIVAGIEGIRDAVTAGDATIVKQELQRVRSTIQVADANDLLIYDRQGRLLYADSGAAPSAVPLTLQSVLSRKDTADQGIEAINRQPALVGGAVVWSTDPKATLAGAVAVVEPIASRLLAQTQEQTGTPCSIFDPSGHLIAVSQEGQPWPTAFPAQTLRPRATASGGSNAPAGTHVPAASGADAFLLPLINPRGDLAATLVLYQPTTAVRHLQGLVQGLFLALILAGLLVSATVAWLFSGMLVRPIRQLALAADDIARGQYDHPIPVGGADEIGKLTKAFERMRRRVGETTRALMEEKGHSEEEAIVVNAVLNATNDGIIMLNAEGRLRVANRRWESMFGLDGATLATLSPEALRTRLRRAMADPEAFDRASDALLQDPERTAYAEEFAQRWPEPRPLRRFSAPVRAQNGDIIGRVFVYSDISKERQADELKQALLSTVSHELRTPLTTIKGYARTLLIDEWDPETRQEFLRIVDEEADKLSELVDNLLDLSKLEAGVLQIHRRPLLLRPLLERIVQRRQETWRRHQFAVACDDDLPLVMADARRLEQVVENLIENGRKYAGGGIIQVEAHRSGEYVEVSVSDQGPGIPDELKERVFERFFRIDNSLSRVTGGTGLGLSICRGLIEAHGGSIRIKATSTAGTTIAFTVPVMPGARTAARPHDRARTAPVTAR